LLFNDGSTDDTLTILHSIKKENPKARIFNHEQNKGLGQVLTTGYFTATMENVISIPGDGQFDPKELIPVAPVPPRTIVAFYRQENLTYSFFRNKLSYVHKMLNKYLVRLDLKAVNWTIIFKREALDSLDLRLTSTLIKSEICAKMIDSGFQVQEVPSVYHTREHGVSKGCSGKMVFLAAKDVLKLMEVVWLFKLSRRRGAQ